MLDHQSPITMPPNHYSWNRFWQPWDGTAVPPSTDFLPDITAGWPAEAYDYRSLANLDDRRGLVLLGEPGIGKSQEVADEVTRLRANGRAVEFFDLKSLASADRLERKIFDCPAFKALEAGESDLTLFLDSIDEGRIVIESLTEVLKAELAVRLKVPAVAKGLRLRITCRSKEWPSSFGEDLRRLFGEKAVQIWHLCQLRRKDVERAASAEGLHSEDFLASVSLHKAVALAAKPVTLRMLLRLQREKGELPSRQVDLYRSGLMELCKDPNDYRVEQDELRWCGCLGSESRYAVARRIAGLSILSQRLFVQGRVRTGADVDGNILTVADIYGTETVGSEAITINESVLREVLGCGLFRGTGPDLVSWAHQSYAEFLAADWLAVHGLPSRQLDALIYPTGETKGRVAPQIHEMVAWLSSLDDDLGRRLMEANPDILMHSDVLASDGETRCQLALLFLKAVEAGHIAGPGKQHPYARLASSGLGDVIRPFITDTHLQYHTRYSALQIARECSIQSLADALIRLALDESEPSQLRNLALLALEKVATPSDLSAIVSLQTHLNEELQAIAIRLLWPRTISTADALAHIRPTVDTSLIGWHWRLISEDIIQRLPPRDLAIALDWMAGFIERYPDVSYDSVCWACTKLAKDLWRLGTERFAENDVRSTLIRLAGAIYRSKTWRWGQRGNGKDYQAPQSTGDRRRFAYLLLMELGCGNNASFALVDEFATVNADDVCWLVSRLDAEADAAIATSLCDLIVWVLSRDDESGFLAAYEAMSRHPELARRWAEITGYVRLDCPAATHRRERYLISKMTTVDERPEPDLDQLRRLAQKCLHEVIAGKPAAWPRFIECIQGQEHLNTLGSGLASLWGWQHLDDNIRAQVVPAAERYLSAGQPGGDYWSRLPGYRAFEHLEKYASSKLDNLPKEVWGLWAPVILCHSLNNDEILGPCLANRCYVATPDSFRDAFRRYGTRSPSHCLKGVWDDELGRILAEKLLLPGLGEEALESAIYLLVQHMHLDGLAYVCAAVEGRVRGNRRIQVVSAALLASEGKLWPVIWPHLFAEPKFGVDVLMAAGRDSDKSGKIALTADQWAEAYLFLRSHSPNHETTPQARRHRIMRTPNRFRDDVPSILAGMGTTDALNALGHIHTSSPDLDWIIHYIIDCRENMRRQAWEPPTPEAMLKLISQMERRFVRSGEELLEVLGESLARFEAELHAQQPAIGDLWNTPEGNYRPKSENELSDVLTRFFRRDLVGTGIVANREVEVRPSRGNSSGERTDIHIDAVIGNDTITVVIEVKGCWHKEVNNAMKSQLLDRYLGDSGIRHGIYAVFWFECETWNNQDYRRSDARGKVGTDLGQTRQTFDAQASDLCGNGRQIKAIVIDAAWR